MHGQSTLKDLCAADKEKIGKMLQSVAALNSENASLKENLKAVQLKHQDELAALKQRGDQSMLDEADTRGKLSQALSLLAQYEERIQVVTRQMHAQESLLGETQSRMQQVVAELESCRVQLSAALQRPPQRSVMVQSMHSATPVGIQTDRWLESNSTVLPMPQQPPQPQSPPRSGHVSLHASPSKGAIADSVLLGSVRNSFTSLASEAVQPAAAPAPAPALLSLKHLNSLVSRLASSGIRPQVNASSAGNACTSGSASASESRVNDQWLRSSSAPWNSTSAHSSQAFAASATSPSHSIDASSYTVSHVAFDPRRSATNGRNSLDSYDVTLVDLVESIELNRPKSSRLTSASAVRSSLRSNISSARHMPHPALLAALILTRCAAGNLAHRSPGSSPQTDTHRISAEALMSQRGMSPCPRSGRSGFTDFSPRCRAYASQ
jgi:hypothetical protein